jgi:hypothetical protein
VLKLFSSESISKHFTTESQALERVAISDSALSQVQALCVMSSSNASTSSFEDAAIRARLFWYAYTQEGITIGLHGGRFVLCVDVLLPAFSYLS